MFPEAPVDDILKVVGNLLYYHYMNPATGALDVVDVGMDNQLSPDQVGVGVEWIVRSTRLSDILIVAYCTRTTFLHAPQRRNLHGFIANVLHHSLRGKRMVDQLA